MRPKRIVRPKEGMHRLGCGHTYFYENYVRTGRLRLIPLGPRNRGILESELEELIDTLAAQRDEPTPATDDDKARRRPGVRAKPTPTSSAA